jgi:hypothetical protein
MFLISMGECILASINSDSASINKDSVYDSIQVKGCYTVNCIIPEFLLNDTVYSVSVFLSIDPGFSDMTIAEQV